MRARYPIRRPISLASARSHISPNRPSAGFAHVVCASLIFFNAYLIFIVAEEASSHFTRFTVSRLGSVRPPGTVYASVWEPSFALTMSLMAFRCQRKRQRNAFDVVSRHCLGVHALGERVMGAHCLPSG